MPWGHLGSKISSGSAEQTALLDQAMIAKNQGMAVQAGLDAATGKSSEVGKAVFRQVERLEGAQ